LHLFDIFCGLDFVCFSVCIFFCIYFAFSLRVAALA
jgi:hypothetical protein